MDKFISKETTENEVSIILPTEKIFSIKLMEALGKDFKIIKSKEKYFVYFHLNLYLLVDMKYKT